MHVASVAGGAGVRISRVELLRGVKVSSGCRSITYLVFKRYLVSALVHRYRPNTLVVLEPYLWLEPRHRYR